MSLHNCDPPIQPLSCSCPVARVGLERTLYNVSEGVGVVELCAVVYEPNITCPIQFPFEVRLSTADGTAGIYVLLWLLIYWSSSMHCAYMYKHASGILPTMNFLQLTQRTTGN